MADETCCWKVEHPYNLLGEEEKGVDDDEDNNNATFNNNRETITLNSGEVLITLIDSHGDGLLEARSC